MREKSFRAYIHRTLKVVYPELHITRPALEAVDSIVRVCATELVDRSLVLTGGSDKKTVSDQELSASCRLILPEALVERYHSSATQSCETYKNCVTNKTEDSGDKKAQTRESRAGLVFSVSAAEKYLRCFGQNGYHVSANAPVYLASLLQNLTNDLLKAGGHECVENKRVTITVRHLFIGVTNDQNLERLVDSLQIVFLSAGVESHIEDKLLEKKPRKRLAPTTEGAKRPHRWRPGTKTLMDIRRLQKGNDLLMQSAPFNRLAREVGEKEFEGMRCTAEFLTSLHSLVEDRMIRVIRSANTIAIHAGRETLYARDLVLARTFMEPLLRASTRTYESNVPEAALRKMSLRAGVKRYGDDSTVECKNLLVQLLEHYLHDVIVCAQLHGAQTMNTKLMVEALSMRGVHLSITPHRRKVGKKGSSSSRTTSTESVAESDGVSDVEENEEMATIEE
jgi:histone H3